MSTRGLALKLSVAIAAISLWGINTAPASPIAPFTILGDTGTIPQAYLDAGFTEAGVRREHVAATPSHVFAQVETCYVHPANPAPCLFVWTRSVTTISKDPYYKDFHRRRALESGRFATAAEVIGLSSDLIGAAGRDALSALSLYVGTLSPEVGTSIAIGLAVLGVVLAPPSAFLGAAALASIAIVGSFAAYMSSTHERLASDPPDPNYREVAQYSGSSFKAETALDANGDKYLTDFFQATFLASESLEGELVSYERAYGAIEAGDAQSFLRQLETANAFSSDFDLYSSRAGEFLLGLPTFLHSRGVEDWTFGAGESAYAALAAYGASLGATIATPTPPISDPSTSVPEPGTFAMLALGLFVLAEVRRRTKHRG